MGGLAVYVQEAFKTDPFSGVIFVFRPEPATVWGFRHKPARNKEQHERAKVFMARLR
jgi:hypothetical protein